MNKIKTNKKNVDVEYEKYFQKYLCDIKELLPVEKLLSKLTDTSINNETKEALLYKYIKIEYPVYFLFSREELNQLAEEIGIDRELTDREVFDISTVMLNSPFVLDIMQEIKEVIDKATEDDETALWAHGEIIDRSNEKVDPNNF
jgi:hypothetical protein